MKRFVTVLIVFLFLAGCAGSENSMEHALAFRQKLLQQSGCQFVCDLTADYGDTLYQFKLACKVDSNGTVSFVVTEPSTIAGISGTISGSGTNVKFDENVLGFPILSEDLPTPLGAPWLFIAALRGGYIRTCDIKEGKMALTVADSYEEDTILLHIEFDEKDNPTSCEFIWKGRRFLTMQITLFHYL